MTPEFTEQLDRHDHSTDVRRRKDSAETDRYGPPINARKVTIKPVAGLYKSSFWFIPAGLN